MLLLVTLQDVQGIRQVLEDVCIGQLVMILNLDVPLIVDYVVIEVSVILVLHVQEIINQVITGVQRHRDNVQDLIVTDLVLLNQVHAI